MNDYYHKEYSEILGRDMEHAVFGDAGGLLVAFGPQNGHTYDFRNFGMIDSIAPWIEAGKLRVLCVDSIDEETWSNEGGDPRWRLEQQERWFHYVTDELMPKYLREGERAITTGCSMGATHAANFFFRRPDIFCGMIALSGLYDTSYFFHDYHDDLTYANSPIEFLKGMPEDHPWMGWYEKSAIIFCSGQGAWEDEMREDLNELHVVLEEKGITHWADYWGYDVNHDWPWWQKQLPYFISHILGEA
ncbi:MAG: esterase family protein [Mogibacterium sp.]|nr:esterase family protein [Mogibacterium sp.]